MKRTLFCIILFCSAAAHAADAPVSSPNEIVYRTNLGRADDVKMLLDSGASPDMKNKDGVPILALASARKDPEGINVVRTLVAAKADINATDAKGQSALFYAARQGNKEIVHFLLTSGINYYSTDKNGDIARTIAHRAKHPEIVKAMDAFVTAQAEAVNQQYIELNKAIEARYKALADEAEKQRIQPPDLPLPEKPGTVEKKENDDEPGTDVTENPVAPTPPTQMDPSGVMRDLSFKSCVFQYWSFCKEAKQTTELKGDDLDNAIDEHQKAILSLRESSMTVYKLNRKYVDGVVENAKQRIFKQLNSMPSKTWRFEHGVCKTADMMTRCEEISESWSNKTESKRSKSKKSKADVDDGDYKQKINTSGKTKDFFKIPK